MKKLFLPLVALLILLAGCSKKAGSSQNVAELLPENTEFMLKFSSVSDMYKYLSVTENSSFGEPIDNLDSIKKIFGFNPYNLSDLESKGFDTKGTFGVALSDFKWQSEMEELDFNGLVYIPVNDGKKAIETIKNIFKINPQVSSDFTIADEGEFVCITKNGQQQKIYLYSKAGYLYAAASLKGDSKDYLTKLTNGTLGKLSSSKYYQDVIAKVDDKKEFFSYVNINKLIAANIQALDSLAKNSYNGSSAQINSLEYLKDYEGAGASIDFSKNDLVVNAVANFVKNSKTLNLMKQASFDKSKILGFKENPLLILSFALNYSEYYKSMMSAIGENGRSDAVSYFEMIKKSFGIDIEKDLIDNLAGNINFGMYDGANINMMNYNTVLTINVKDENKVREVLEKFIAKLPPDQKGLIRKEKDYYIYTIAGFVQLFIGVKDKNLIASIGQPMFDKALSADIKTGFITTLKDKELAKDLQDQSNVLYINVEETFKAYNNFSGLLSQLAQIQPLDQQRQNIINQFEYFLFTGKAENNSLVAKYVIKTKFQEPFLISLVKMVSKLKPEPATTPNAPVAAE
jgi:hypothetical protein